RKVRHGGGAGPGGDVNGVWGGEGGEPAATAGGGGARAGRAATQLVLVRLGGGAGPSESLFQPGRAAGGGGRELGRERRRACDRREVGLRIVSRALGEGLGLGMRADGTDSDAVSVGRRIGHALGADLAAAAADILDDDLLTEDFTHARGNDAPKHIGRTACRKWDHHGYRAGRIVLRVPRRRERAHGGNRRAKQGPQHWASSCCFAADMGYKQPW